MRANGILWGLNDDSTTGRRGGSCTPLGSISLGNRLLPAELGPYLRLTESSRIYISPLLPARKNWRLER